MLNPDVRRHVENSAVAHLATVLPDGSPHSVPLWVDTHGDHLVFLTGPHSQKARNLRRDPRVAISLTPADNTFEPVVIRGRVIDWLTGDEAWAIVDRIAMKHTGRPYSRDLERVVAVVEADRQTIGVG